jgi:UTP--glucose-1-phosphate uridylyltransferase
MRLGLDRDLVLSSAKDKIVNSRQSPEIQAYFSRALGVVIDGGNGFISSEGISSPVDVKSLDDLNTEYSNCPDYSRLVVMKLNGGLGTTMGLSQAKSLIPVRSDTSFLDIIVQQIKALRLKSGVPVPLILMNSFYTEKDSLEKIDSKFNEGSDLPLSILQHKVPRLYEDSLLPVFWPENEDLEWCPPGHGDLYTVLQSSGLLKLALGKGYKYLFISNSDNLGAVVSEKIFNYIQLNQIPFLMEVATRTDVDRKGGHLAVDAVGQLALRESAQVAQDDMQDFQDISRYGYFNTNSIWIDLEALEGLLSQYNGILPLPVIVNSKNIVAEDAKTPKVVQLETAMGSAISLFPGAKAIHVPRSRFLPVKSTEDLLRLKSDLVDFDDSMLPIGIGKDGITLNVELDSRYYQTLKDFESRFPHGPPSLKNCSSFKVAGDITFGSNVTCLGDVFISALGGKSSTVIDGTVLQGVVNL